MSGPIRQSNLFAAEDFLKVFRSFRDVDFTAYDFDTIRSSLVEYIKQQFPEDFNDFIESSEFIAIIELLSYLSSSLALRTDINSRENFLDTAERRESIIRLARMLSYNPKRRIPGKGLFKITSVETNEPITDSLGRDLKSVTVFWNDENNVDSFEQFITILNAAFNPSNPFGKPSKSGTISDIATDLYQVDSVLPRNIFEPVSLTIPDGQIPWDIVNPDFTDNETFFERHPDSNEAFHLIYKNDGAGLGSNDTGFFLYLKQGRMAKEDFRLDFPTKNRVLELTSTEINQEDVYFQEIDEDGTVATKWTRVPALVGNNVVFNSLELDVRDIFNVISEFDDGVKLKFADGNFGNVPKGLYRTWFRQSYPESYTLRPENASNLQVRIPYNGKNGQPYSLILSYELQESINNAVPAETNEEIKLNAPAVFFTQNRMVNAEDYNVFPLSRGNEVTKIRAINRTHAGHSRFIDINDPTGLIQNVKVFAEDGALYKDYEPERLEIELTSSISLETVIEEDLFNFMRNQRLNNFFYDDYYKDYDVINGSALDYESLGFLWGTLPQKDIGATGFLYDSLDTSAIEDWVYNDVSGEWEYLAAGYTPTEGILLRAGTRFTTQAITGITDDQFSIAGGRIIFSSTYTPTNGDTLRINYREPVNTNTGNNKFIEAGASATFFNPASPTQEKKVNIKSVVDSGLPPSPSVSDIGPIELSDDIIDSWQLKSVLPRFRLEFTALESSAILTQMQLQNDFALGFDVTANSWYVIPSGKIDLGTTLDNNNFDLATQGAALDSSWLIYADYQAPTSSGGNAKYVFTTRGRRYVFESLREVRFFYSPEQTAIDIQTGRAKEDEISILDINKKPETTPDEVWTYTAGTWSNGTLSYPDSVGIVLAVKDATTQTITSNDNDIGVADVDTRGTLITNTYTWSDGNTITIGYNLNGKLDDSLLWNIHRSFILEDGYLDQTKIEIKPVDTDEDGVPDCPLSFDEFIASDDLVYFERYIDFDGYEFFRPWVTGYNTVTTPTNFDFVNEEFDGLPISDTGLFLFADEQAILDFIGAVEEPDNYLVSGETLISVPLATRLDRQFAYARALEFKIALNVETGVFYDIPLIEPPDPPTKPVIDYNFGRFEIDFDHYTRNGRSFTLDTFQDTQIPLWFKWKHFAPTLNRIDPSVSNIIDMYILTSAYYSSVQLWKAEDGDLEEFPEAPTTEDLRVQFGDLSEFKMLSDQIIFNSAQFRILFGRQAASELRAKFKVVKLPSTFVSDSEIKSKVIEAIDQFFDIANWDFGESFFYTELAAYIHQQLATIISSVVIVPDDQESQFGDLFQIRAEPTELFLSTASVSDIEIVDSLTDANMRLK